MSDEDQLIKCPSCGHENAPYVDKCIICDFPLARYMNQPQTRPINQARIVHDELIAQTNKKLGPLPDSDLLIDKRKKKQSASHALQCPECGEKSRVGTVLCSNCGARLDTLIPLNQPDSVVEETQDAIPFLPNERDTDTHPVQHLDMIRNHPTEIPAVVTSEILTESVKDIPAGCVKFTSWMMLQLDVIGHDTPIVIRPQEDKPLLVGRRHKSLPMQPHIDLTPYLTDKHGVSRRHALLRLRGTRLELQDLKSTNGTSINGIRFSPKESHQLRHQDVIQIGQIQMRVSFIQLAHSASSGQTEELM
jgi:ribosomal protein L32